MYPNTQLFIAGQWQDGASNDWQDVLNPVDNQAIGKVAVAETKDLDLALEAAQSGFETWKQKTAFERYSILLKTANLLRSKIDEIAPIMTMEQGKPLAEASGELALAADVITWFAEEARRTYGRLIPARMNGIHQYVRKEPVGPVAAFTPWNFPVNQAVRKISAALASGCSIIVKGPEETPASLAALIALFHEAGVSEGAINLVYGRPAEISSYLIAHPVIQKISFTGSTQVGKLLAAQAGSHMKRITMELGGHAPVVIMPDADIERAANILVGTKFRNAGQVCISPTRFLLHEDIADQFTESFVAQARSVKVGNGLEEGISMGPLANERRVEAVDELIKDAIANGAKLACGGKRLSNEGNFYAPTVLTDVSSKCRIMNEEPFGPVALLSSFANYDDMISEANRLPYGLAAYAYTGSDEIAARLSEDINAGMLSINHHGLSMPETPFGGIKDSGYGSEGGVEAMEAYLVSKFVTHLPQ